MVALQMRPASGIPERHIDMLLNVPDLSPHVAILDI
jgi:hypothetical protein